MKLPGLTCACGSDELHQVAPEQEQGDTELPVVWCAACAAGLNQNTAGAPQGAAQADTRFPCAPPGRDGVQFPAGNRSQLVTNRTTLAQLREMDAKQASSLPTAHLAMLLEDVAAQKADTKTLDDRLNDAMALRFGPLAAEARAAAGKDTGRVSLDDGEFVVRADLPKSVTWDQSKLEAAVDVVRSWGDPVSDYVGIKLTVAESKYTAWPATIRNVFEPARTVGTGKATFSIERRAA